MRILYILTTLGVGGAEKQVVGLAERMAAQGHAVTLLTLKHADEEWPVKLPAMRLNLPKTLPGILRGLGFARNFVAAFRPDLLHSHTFPANLFTRLLALRLRFGGKAPTVVNTIHNVHEGGWHRMALYAVTDPLVDKVTAVSEAAARRFVRLRAVPQRKMQVLTNGIDTEAFAPDGARRRQTRMLMHTPLRAANQFVWLAVGRLAPAKDYPNLLSAFARVRSAFPDCCLWIAGEGDASGFDRLQSGESGVRFLGLRRDVAALLDAADGFVLASAWEGMPLALGEAMAMQKPVAATDVGGVRELAGETGSLVPAGDSETLASAMLDVMLMEEFDRKRLGRAARERILQFYSMDAKAAEWHQLYAELLDERRL